MWFLFSHAWRLARDFSRLSWQELELQHLIAIRPSGTSLRRRTLASSCHRRMTRDARAVQRLTFPFPFVHHQTHDLPEGF